MSNRIEPELVELIEEIVSRRLKEELEERSKLVTVDQFAEAMDKIDRRFDAMQNQMDVRFKAMQNQMDDRFKAMQNQMDRRFDAAKKERNAISTKLFGILNDIQAQLGKSFE
ncbi:MAG: hypothetical protein EU549_00230 [Promethearchaeota archaeon]|nr:MAG: hypothetical protein EU549_00230 [Candidatus Lokiarchaeota archaeon]